MNEQPIYLDHSATTPLHPSVVDAMLPFLTNHFGNAGSLHRAGRTAHKAIEKAREQVAALIGAEPREIVFTGSGSEANNLAITGLRIQSTTTQQHVAASAIEHHSVLEPSSALNKASGIPRQPIAVDPMGLVSIPSFEEALASHPRLISIMTANNEVGTIQTIEQIGQLCRNQGVLFHTDAVQAMGKIPLNVQALPIDALTLSAHKIQGPKGIGALYHRHGTLLHPLIRGGAQENKRRAGTENVAAIVGFGQACQLAAEQETSHWSETQAKRDQLEAAILKAIPGSWVNAAGSNRLPHITNIGFQDLEGEAIMMALDAQGFAVGTGSACSSGSLDPSHVLLAMGQSHAHAHAAIRISLSTLTRQSEITALIQTLPNLIQELRTARNP